MINESFDNTMGDIIKGIGSFKDPASALMAGRKESVDINDKTIEGI